MKLLNAFSIGMLDGRSETIRFQRINLNYVQDLAKRQGIDSYIGHADTAQILTNLIGIDCSLSRRGFAFTGQEQAVIVAQYAGERLPEGVTSLPEGAEFRFYLLTMYP